MSTAIAAAPGRGPTRTIPNPSGIASRAVRVASAPRRHVYTRHLRHPAFPTIHIAPDDATYRAAQMLDADWVDRHAGRIDVFHLHFGFGDVALDALVRWRHALRAHRIPLVYTVHDLDNPHVDDQEHHHRQVSWLLEEADELVTLTDAAADAIAARSGRRPLVVPHPHVLTPLERLGLRPPAAHDFTIGIHAKDLRAGIDVIPFVEATVELLRRRADLHLRIDLRPDCADTHPVVTERLGRLVDSHPRITVVPTGYLPDAGLWQLLRSVDLAVLPYRAGTHSGWLEACADVGTPVAVPAWMPASRQHVEPHVHPLPVTDGHPDVDRLETIVDRAHHRPDPVAWPDRRDDRRRTAAVHDAIYRRLAGLSAGDDRERVAT